MYLHNIKGGQCPPFLYLATVILFSGNMLAESTYAFSRGTGNSIAVKLAIPLISAPPPP